MSNAWEIYQRCLLRNIPPNHATDVNTDEVSGLLDQKKAFFARWTSDFDCGYKTEWWYCVKDGPIDLDKMTSKQRYRIKRGLKFCVIENVTQHFDSYFDDLFEIQKESFLLYPSKYRPTTTRDSFQREMKCLSVDCDLWVAKDRETNIACGYAIVRKQMDFVWLKAVKVSPRFMNNDVNAIIVYEIVNHYLGNEKYKYICDGERNIRHQTNYQEFLVKNLNFRYSYCRLHILYSSVFNRVVKILFPFRNIIYKIGEYNSKIYNVACLLKQDEIYRSFK